MKKLFPFTAMCIAGIMAAACTGEVRRNGRKRRHRGYRFHPDRILYQRHNPREPDKGIPGAGTQGRGRQSGRKGVHRRVKQIEPSRHRPYPRLPCSLSTALSSNVTRHTAATARRQPTISEQPRSDGFTSIAKVDIMDAEGDTALPIAGGRHIKYDLVGKNYPSYDFTVVLSHFKGHAMGGFGGALKNISIGIASSNGKAWIHSAGRTSDPAKLWTACRHRMTSLSPWPRPARQS